MDKKAHSQLVRESLALQQQLVCYAYSLLGDWSLAQDAVQETLVVVSTSPESYREQGRLASWLKRITYFKSMDILRARRGELSVDDLRIMELVDAQSDFDQRSSAARHFEERKEKLSHCLGLLNRTSFDIFLKYYRDGMKTPEIARHFERSSNAVWLNLSRTRKALEKCLNRQVKL